MASAPVSTDCCARARQRSLQGVCARNRYLGPQVGMQKMHGLLAQCNIRIGVHVELHGHSLSNLAAYLLEQALVEHLPNNAVLDHSGRLSLPSHVDRSPNAMAYNATKR